MSKAAACPVTGAPTYQVDTVTGLPFADGTALKMIQNVAFGGGRWSGLLDAWAGQETSAQAVPHGFWEGIVEVGRGQDNNDTT